MSAKKTMTVKLNCVYGKHTPNEVVELDEDVANSLIKDGNAKELSSDVEVDPKKLDAENKKLVAQVQALADEASKKDEEIASLKEQIEAKDAEIASLKEPAKPTGKKNTSGK